MVRVENERGFIEISASVVTFITGSAATNCFGVKGMAQRSVRDGFVHLLKREVMSRGVKIFREDVSSISIELHIVVEHGVNIPVVCNSIISEVAYYVNKYTGINVQKVNVFVDSIVCD